MMEEYISLIGTLGFPIVMCLLVWNFMRTGFKENTKALQELKFVIAGLHK